MSLMCVHVILSRFFFKLYGDHLDLHVLTHSVPTRRSSDLSAAAARASWTISGTGSTGVPTDRSTTPSACAAASALRSEEHTSELQSLMRISYAVFCSKQKNTTITRTQDKLDTTTPQPTVPHIL